MIGNIFTVWLLLLNEPFSRRGPLESLVVGVHPVLRSSLIPLSRKHLLILEAVHIKVIRLITLGLIQGAGSYQSTKTCEFRQLVRIKIAKDKSAHHFQQHIVCNSLPLNLMPEF